MLRPASLPTATGVRAYAPSPALTLGAAEGDASDVPVTFALPPGTHPPAQHAGCLHPAIPDPDERVDDVIDEAAPIAPPAAELS